MKGNLGFWHHPSSETSLLLDIYTGAGIAYSAARKLRSDYTGYAMRIRRGSDNATLDIGFDVSNNLDEAAITTFIDLDDAYVAILYDQSGNGHNLIPLDQNDFIIAVTGTIIKVNGIPSIRQDNGCFITTCPTSAVVGSSEQYVIARSVLGTFGNFSTPLFVTDGSAGLYLATDGASSTYLDDYDSVPGVEGNIAISSNAPFILEGSLESASAINLYVNGTLDSDTVNTGSFTLIGTTTVYVNYFSDSQLQEVIVWPSNQSSNRANIYANLNTYYN